MNLQHSLEATSLPCLRNICCTASKLLAECECPHYASKGVQTLDHGYACAGLLPEVQLARCHAVASRVAFKQPCCAVWQGQPGALATCKAAAGVDSSPCQHHDSPSPGPWGLHPGRCLADANTGCFTIHAVDHLGSSKPLSA